MNQPGNQRIDDRQLINSGFRYAASLTQNRHDAEDLIQQACLKVLRSHGNVYPHCRSTREVYQEFKPSMGSKQIAKQVRKILKR